MGPTSRRLAEVNCVPLPARYMHTYGGSVRPSVAAAERHARAPPARRARRAGARAPRSRRAAGSNARAGSPQRAPGQGEGEGEGEGEGWMDTRTTQWAAAPTNRCVLRSVDRQIGASRCAIRLICPCGLQSDLYRPSLGRVHLTTQYTPSLGLGLGSGLGSGLGLGLGLGLLA